MQCNLMQCNVISLRNEKIEQNIFQKWSQINLMKSDTLIFFFLGGGGGGFRNLEKINKETALASRSHLE